MYDADQLEEVAKLPDDELVEGQRNMILDPHDPARVPMKFLANLFGAGHEGVVRYALGKQKAVRWHRRAITVGDTDRATANRMLREADCTAEEAEEIYTTLGWPAAFAARCWIQQALEPEAKP